MVLQIGVTEDRANCKVDVVVVTRRTSLKVVRRVFCRAIGFTSGEQPLLKEETVVELHSTELARSISRDNSGVLHPVLVDSIGVSHPIMGDPITPGTISNSGDQPFFTIRVDGVTNVSVKDGVQGTSMLDPFSVTSLVLEVLLPLPGHFSSEKMDGSGVFD